MGQAREALIGLQQSEADAAIRKAASLARRLAIQNGCTLEEQAELQHHITEAAQTEWQRPAMAGGVAGRGVA